MLIELIGSLLNKLGIIILFAFFFSRPGWVQSYLQKERLSAGAKVVFALLFGILGIIGTYSGVPVNGAIANSRSIGVIVAGLFAGPSVGLAAGLIAGIHRMLLPTGRFTAIACGLSTIIGGVMAGFAKPLFLKAERKWLFGGLLTILIEAIQMMMILLIARPFADAVALVKIIFIPMAFINACGTGVFILLIEQIHEKSEINAGLKAKLALEIATKTLPILRRGLDRHSAQEVCSIILEETGMDALSLTDETKILAHVGVGDDHHLPGKDIYTKTTKQALESGQVVIASSKEEIECSEADCQLQSAIVVPLFLKDQVKGTLKLYKTSNGGMTPSDVELARGLGYLFSTQIELSRLSYQEELMIKSELKALQAQIQPHFLFNTLNTIISFCRTDPQEARSLLLKLSSHLRASFKTATPFVPIEKELEHIKNYLDIEEARFAHRLEVNYHIDENIRCDVPPLILQPLVENALKHGLVERAEGGRIEISIYQMDDAVCLSVYDNGIGMSAEDLSSLVTAEGPSGGVGLVNVMNRMRIIYGTDPDILSSPQEGTTIKLYIPNQLTKKGESSYV